LSFALSGNEQQVFIFRQQKITVDVAQIHVVNTLLMFSILPPKFEHDLSRITPRASCYLKTQQTANQEETTEIAEARLHVGKIIGISPRSCWLCFSVSVDQQIDATTLCLTLDEPNVSERFSRAG
jgi:hypothetical protein